MARTPAQTRTAIDNLLDYLLSRDIALLQGRTDTVAYRHGYRVGYVSNPSYAGTRTSPEFATIDEYRSMLEHHAYSCVLYDGSIIQLSYDFGRRDLIRHRLAFYPCPCDLDTELIRSENVLDVFDMHCSSTTDIRLRSPLRMDFDPEHAKLGHPASHLHVNYPECRCPVVSAVSPEMFVRFVFKNFYPSIWAEELYFQGLRSEKHPHTISVDDARDMHVSYR